MHTNFSTTVPQGDEVEIPLTFHNNYFSFEIWKYFYF